VGWADLMFNFADVRLASKQEQIRAWSVEQSIDLLRDAPLPMQSIIEMSKMIEDYVTNGDISGVIQNAVEEGYSEGRFEVKAAVEEWFSNVDLDDLFRTKGWLAKEEEGAPDA
jgi:hypothetical protein